MVEDWADVEQGCGNDAVGGPDRSGAGVAGMRNPWWVRTNNDLGMIKVRRNGSIN